MSEIKRAKAGSTHHCWQFAGEVIKRIRWFKTHPDQFNFVWQSSCKSLFSEYKRNTKEDPQDFEIVMYKFATDSVGHQHCVVIISNFWAEFFNALSKIMKLTYRQWSEIFLVELLQIGPPITNGWTKHFHVHFMKTNEVPVDLRGWTEWRDEHHSGPIDTSKFKHGPWLLELDELGDPNQDQIGWVPVDPHKLHVRKVLVK